MKKAVWIISIIAVFLVLGAIGVIYYSTTQAVVGTCSGGTTILSISTATVTTSTNLAGKEVLRVTAVANGGGECLTIGWSANDLENELGEEYQVDKGVYGNLITNSQSQTFTVNLGQPIYKISYGQKKSGTFCSISNCERDYDNVLDGVRTGLLETGTCYCFYKTLIGRDGQFSSTFTKDFDVSFNIDGLGSVDLTQARQSGKISDKAFIKWSGDLFSGTWLTIPNYDDYFSNSLNRWSMAIDGFGDDISDRLEDEEDCLETDCDRKTSAFETRYDFFVRHTNSYNSFVDLKKSNKDSTFVSQESSVKSIDWDGNRLTADLNVYTTWQVFTIDLDADWVGIHKNVGQPSVNCPSDCEGISGQANDVILRVKDTLGTRPTFGLSLNCVGGSGSLQQSRISNIGTSYQDINGYVTATVPPTEGERDVTCTFRAYDLNEPDNDDDCSFICKITSFRGCTPESKYCSSDASQLGTCNSAGTNYNWVDCEFGCEAFGSTYRCRLQAKEICDDGIDNDGDGLIDFDDPDCVSDECGWWITIPEFEILGKTYGGQGIIPDLFCHINNFLAKFKLIFAVVVGFLGGLLSASYLSRFLGKRELKKTWWMLLITFIVLGGAIGFIAYSYFLWIVLILIVLGIVRAFIPGV